MNHALTQLQPYPFEKLRALLGSVKPAADKRAIALSIGEPKHESPAFVAQAMADNLDKLAVYPSTIGLPALRQAIGQWCERRFGVPAGWLDADRHILPVNGTREALFAFTQAVVNRADDGLVVSPNPILRCLAAPLGSPLQMLECMRVEAMLEALHRLTGVVGIRILVERRVLAQPVLANRLCR